MSMRLIGMHLVGVDPMGVYLIGVDLIGMHLIGMHLLQVDNFTKRFVCEVTPHANSPSPELALEIAPLIHSGQGGDGLCNSLPATAAAAAIAAIVRHYLNDGPHSRTSSRQFSPFSPFTRRPRQIRNTVKQATLSVRDIELHHRPRVLNVVFNNQGI
jgi:hypothetical protein